MASKTSGILSADRDASRVFDEKGINGIPKTEKERLAYIDALGSLTFLKELKREGAFGEVLTMRQVTDESIRMHVDIFTIAFAPLHAGVGPQRDIVLTNFFFNAAISNNNEAISVMLHEGQHVRDQVLGLFLGRGGKVTKKNVRHGFYTDVLELRAYYAELSSIGKGLAVGAQYLESTAKQFESFKDHMGHIMTRWTASDQRKAAVEARAWKARQEWGGEFDLNAIRIEERLA